MPIFQVIFNDANCKSSKTITTYITKILKSNNKSKAHMHNTVTLNNYSVIALTQYFLV